jgi:hypothetical protein
VHWPYNLNSFFEAKAAISNWTLDQLEYNAERPHCRWGPKVRSNIRSKKSHHWPDFRASLQVSVRDVCLPSLRPNGQALGAAGGVLSPVHLSCGGETIRTSPLSSDITQARREGPEKHHLHFTGSNHSNQLAHRDVHHNHDEQKKLYRYEMSPDEMRE